MLRLPLLACDTFRPGERGYVTNRGVCKLEERQVRREWFPVVAVRYVEAGHHGEFEELPKDAKKLPTD
jgi:hypothetical protein